MSQIEEIERKVALLQIEQIRHIGQIRTTRQNKTHMAKWNLTNKTHIILRTNRIYRNKRT